jgi:hypothetical protein
LLKERRIKEKFRTHLGATFDEEYREKEEEAIQQDEDEVRQEEKKYSYKTHDISGLEDKYYDDIEVKPWWGMEDQEKEIDLMQQQEEEHDENKIETEEVKVLDESDKSEDKIVKKLKKMK